MSERHIKEHLMAMIETFLIDPPDSKYQIGFLAGLLELATDAGMADASILRATGLLMNAVDMDDVTAGQTVH